MRGFTASLRMRTGRMASRANNLVQNEVGFGTFYPEEGLDLRSTILTYKVYYVT